MPKMKEHPRPENCNDCLQLQDDGQCLIFKSTFAACASGTCRAKRTTFEEIEQAEAERKLYLTNRGLTDFEIVIKAAE